MELPKGIQQIKNKFLLVSIWSQDAYPLTLLKTFKFEFMHEFMNTFMFFWLKNRVYKCIFKGGHSHKRWIFYLKFLCNSLSRESKVLYIVLPTSILPHNNPVRQASATIGD